MNLSRWTDVLLPVVGVLMVVLGLTGSARAVAAEGAGMVLRYDKPAGAWVEALPLGNGRLGAMVFGGVSDERLQLNEATLWSGGPKDGDNAKAKDVLPKVREAIFAGLYAEADKLCRQMQGPFNQSYQPLGDLRIRFGAEDAAGAASRPDPASTQPVRGSYERSLDLATGVATTRYEIGGTTYVREVFVSRPDEAVVMRVRAEGGSGKVELAAKLTSQLRSAPAEELADGLVLRGRAPSHVDPNYYRREVPPRYDEGPDAEGMKFEIRLRAVTVGGGEVKREGDTLRVSGAGEVVLVLSAGTSFAGFEKSPGREGVDPTPIAKGHVDAAIARSAEELRARHVADHSALFGRVALDVGSNAEAERLTTDVRIRKFAEGGSDPSLPVVLFQFGRYLLIASSREGGQPANLQGIWNDSMRPPWSSNYTININTQMNYWPAEPAGLSELHRPLVEFVRELSVNGAKTAQVNYGMRGWVSHHNADLWRQSAPVGDYGQGNPVWANYAVSAPWLSQHLWEHFAFTQDKAYLAEVWPVMKGAAEFCLDWLVEDPASGKLVTAPSASPEIGFVTPEGKKGVVTKGTTMDLAIIHDHFTNCIEACEALGIEPEFANKLKATRAKLLPLKIGSRGNIQEWADDFIEQDVHHRHVSHLFALHPGRQITPEQKELFEAARKTLEIRGDDGTGWSLAWKINFWARLRDGDRTYKLMSMLLRPARGRAGGVYPNLFDAHPPFQIDGNFGFTAGVCEALLQSHQRTERGYVLDLLPALPGVWSKGSVTGLRARGGFTVDLAWDGGKLTAAKITAGKTGGRCVLRYGGNDVAVELTPGESVAFDGARVLK